jgi:galactose mutarotase-like enzyme
MQSRASALGALILLTLSVTAVSRAQGISESRFGSLQDGRPVMQYSLRNKSGSEAIVISLGATYHLPANDGENTLHGGTTGFNRAVWDRVPTNTGSNSIRLEYVSADGDQGFPGQLTRP